MSYAARKLGRLTHNDIGRPVIFTIQRYGKDWYILWQFCLNFLSNLFSHLDTVNECDKQTEDRIVLIYIALCRSIVR